MLFAKERHTRIALVHVAKHCGDDMIVIESFPVCACGIFIRSRRASDIVVIPAGQLLLCCLLKLVVSYREWSVLECTVYLQYRWKERRMPISLVVRQLWIAGMGPQPAKRRRRTSFWKLAQVFSGAPVSSCTSPGFGSSDGILYLSTRTVVPVGSEARGKRQSAPPSWWRVGGSPPAAILPGRICNWLLGNPTRTALS